MELIPGTIMSAKDVSLWMTERMHQNVSRTPVREAFLSLAKEGLVNLLPQRGTEVSLINVRRAMEERFIRITLEGAAIDKFVEFAKSEHYKNMEYCILLQSQAIDRGDNLAYVQLDNAFHEILYQVTGNMLSHHIVMTMNGHYDRMRVMTTWSYSNVQGSIEQHRAILQCLRNGDAAAARKLLDQHLSKLLTEKSELIRDYPEFFDMTGEVQEMDRDIRVWET